MDTRAGPTVAPPNPNGLASVLERNIHALDERKKRDEAQASREAKLADAITRFSGSMPFVYIHAVIVIVWTATNVGWLPGVKRFDPTFVILATVASVEAIFLSTFVLISQNRQAEAANRRAELDLQISLLSEHEVTRLLTLVSGIADKLGVDGAKAPELQELERDVAPEAVLDELAADSRRMEAQAREKAKR